MHITRTHKIDFKKMVQYDVNTLKLSNHRFGFTPKTILKCSKGLFEITAILPGMQLLYNYNYSFIYSLILVLYCDSGHANIYLLFNTCLTLFYLYELYTFSSASAISYSM